MLADEGFAIAESIGEHDRFAILAENVRIGAGWRVDGLHLPQAADHPLREVRLLVNDGLGVTLPSCHVPGGVQREDIGDDAIERCRHAFSLPQFHHAPSEPAHFQLIASLEIVMHRGSHVIGHIVR